MADARLGVTVETNMLAYAKGEGNAPRCSVVRELPARSSTDEVMLPVQGLAETLQVLARHSRCSEHQARHAGGDAPQMLLVTNVISVV